MNPVNAPSELPATLQSIHYDKTTQVLSIEFQDGRVYRYAPVPPFIHRALLASASAGTDFHRHIKERYQLRRVR